MTQELKQALKPDICVIGAGAAGRAAASAAAAFGVPVVLIEKGTLGNGGSVPTTALAVTAERANIIRNAAHFGLKAARFGVDFAAVKAHLRDVANTVAPIEARERLAGLGVHVIDGAARFLDARTVAAGDFTIAARRFVIATGSSPALPAIPGLAETPHLTGDTVFDLADCPRHLIVIGAGSARSRTGADIPPARRRRHRARSGDAVGERRSRMRRHRARRARTRRHHIAHRCRDRAGAARAGEDRDRYHDA